MSVELVTSFYEAFAKRDAEGMVSCYADDVRFSDPVFPALSGDDAKNMWRMLCERGKDLAIEFRDVTASGDHGAAHWEATYTFGLTGKRVHNVIDAAFVFRGGKIVQHTDVFDLYRWMRMAMGLKGVLLGWAPPVQNVLRKTAAKGLREYSAGRSRTV